MTAGPPTGVLFDAGGTLLQVNDVRLGRALRDRGYAPDGLEEAFWEVLALVDKEYGQHVHGWWGWFDDWLTRLAHGVGVPADVLRAAWQETDAEAHIWDKAVPGAAECLTRLSRAGLTLGVVSNSDGRCAETLRRVGLGELVELIVDSGVVGVEKPDPAIFDHALEPLGLDPARTWYLGDTVAYDAAAADDAGLTSWVIDHHGLHEEPFPRRVRSLSEFADHVLAARSCGR